MKSGSLKGSTKGLGWSFVGLIWKVLWFYQKLRGAGLSCRRGGRMLTQVYLTTQISTRKWWGLSFFFFCRVSEREQRVNSLYKGFVMGLSWALGPHYIFREGLYTVTNMFLKRSATPFLARVHNCLILASGAVWKMREILWSCAMFAHSWYVIQKNVVFGQTTNNPERDLESTLTFSTSCYNFRLQSNHLAPICECKHCANNSCHFLIQFCGFWDSNPFMLFLLSAFIVWSQHTEAVVMAGATALPLQQLIATLDNTCLPKILQVCSGVYFQGKAFNILSPANLKWV